jgi:hypothetical protein
MIGVHAWVETHPLISAMVLCYLLTFIGVRQIKPFLPHFEVKVTWLPEAFRKRLVLRAGVFICGALISVTVVSGLVIFGCCALTALQSTYIALSVGLLAPFVYDLIIGALRITEWLGVLKEGTAGRVQQFISPKRGVVEVFDEDGELEKLRQDDQTVWIKRGKKRKT